MSLEQNEGSRMPAVQNTSADRPHPQGPPTTIVPPNPTEGSSNDQMIHDPNAIPLPDLASNGPQEVQQPDSLPSESLVPSDQPPLLQMVDQNEVPHLDRQSVITVVGLKGPSFLKERFPGHC